MKRYFLSIVMFFIFLSSQGFSESITFQDSIFSFSQLFNNCNTSFLIGLTDDVNHKTGKPRKESHITASSKEFSSSKIYYERYPVDPKQIPSSLRNAINLDCLHPLCSIHNREIVFHNMILQFPSVSLPPNIDEETIKEYQYALQVLEDILPRVLFQTVQKNIDEALNIACEKLWEFLNALAEIKAKDSMLDKEEVLNKLLLDMHNNPPFKPIKNFSGNVGSDPLVMKQATKMGNPREKMFFLINVFRNLIKPIIEKSNREELAKQFSEKLGHVVFLNNLSPAPYFAYSTEKNIRVREKKNWKKPTIEELSTKNPYMTHPLSERELSYALAMAKLEIPYSGLIYFGSAAEKFRTKTLMEDPDNPYLQAISDAKSPTRCSFSGVTSDILTLCTQLLNLKDPKFITDLRFACLALMIEGLNHSAIEVLLGAASFDQKPVVASPEWYISFFSQELDDKEFFIFLSALKAAMKEKGIQKLPHEILMLSSKEL